MSWQKEAVEAAAKEIDETHIGGMDDARKLAEIVLRAALPLIEVTPGMREAVEPAIDDFYDGTKDASEADCGAHVYKAMNTYCAKEKTP
jgi:hypothetical protein